MVYSTEGRATAYMKRDEFQEADASRAKGIEVSKGETNTPDTEHTPQFEFQFGSSDTLCNVCLHACCKPTFSGFEKSSAARLVASASHTPRHLHRVPD